jgi:hypothetical protein
MELGGKGSFQVYKLQRSARTTVCSHSTKGHGRHLFHQLRRDHNETQESCLSSCGQSKRSPVRNGRQLWSGGPNIEPRSVTTKADLDVSRRVGLAVFMT